MHLNRRMFCLGGAAAVAAPCLAKSLGKLEGHDPSLTVFLSDMHVGQEGRQTIWGKQPGYQNALFEKAVNKVLKMRPLPARTVIFGDLALWMGFNEDYEASLPAINRLKAAGIAVTITMGNHDHRGAFLKFHPEYAKSSPVPGRIVSVVDLGTCDLLLLDSLGENERGAGYVNLVKGVLDKVQKEWLVETVESAKRPFIVGSHHSPMELNVLDLLLRQPRFIGYVYGHEHFWNARWEPCAGDESRFAYRICLPSTGWWGDIGFATCRTLADRAEIALVEDDFFFQSPLKNGEPRPPEWDDILARNRGRVCTLTYPANRTGKEI